MNIKQVFDAVTKANRNMKSENTSLAYRKGLKVFGKYLQSIEVPLEQEHFNLSTDVFVNYPLWLCEKYRNKSTVGIYIASVKRLIDYMIIMGNFTPTNQEMLRIQMSFRQALQRRQKLFPRFPKNGIAEIVKDSVYKMKYPSPIIERNIAIVEFLYSSGCRNNELARLKVKDIDLEDHQAIVIGKGSKQRVVYFSSTTSNALKNYWSLIPDLCINDPAFMRHDRATKVRDNITTTTIRNIIAELIIISGIPKGSFTPHYFRHAFAIKVLQKTKNLALVQDLLGHESPTSTRVYAKIYPEEYASAHNMIYG